MGVAVREKPEVRAEEGVEADLERCMHTREGRRVCVVHEQTVSKRSKPALTPTNHLLALGKSKRERERERERWGVRSEGVEGGGAGGGGGVGGVVHAVSGPLHGYTWNRGGCHSQERGIQREG